MCVCTVSFFISFPLNYGFIDDVAVVVVVAAVVVARISGA